EHMTPEVPLRLLVRLGVAHSPTVAPPAQPGHLGGPDVVDLRRSLLLRVDPERPEEVRQPGEPGAGVPEPQEEVPVKGEGETLVHPPTDLLPDPPPPEQRFLGDEVAPAQDLVVVRREHPTADLAVLLVDDHPVPVHHIDP